MLKKRYIEKGKITDFTLPMLSLLYGSTVHGFSQEVGRVKVLRVCSLFCVMLPRRSTSLLPHPQHRDLTWLNHLGATESREKEGSVRAVGTQISTTSFGLETLSRPLLVNTMSASVGLPN
jgi:hypothetical protein